jgi:hypothetical protein
MKKECDVKGCNQWARKNNLCLEHYVQYHSSSSENIKLLIQLNSTKEKLSMLKFKNKALLKRISDLEVISQYTELLNSVNEHNYEIEKKESSPTIREGTAVALLSDCHVGEVVTLDKVANKNVYNLQIFENRIKKYFRSVADLIKHSQEMFTIHDLVLWLGGDIITGYIHEEIIESSEVSPTIASRIAKEYLKEGIKYLLKHTDVETIHVLCNHGNHGRTGKRKKYSTGAENNYEHIMYLFLADDFKHNKRVNFTVSAGEHLYYKIYDFWTRWMHGDDISYNKGIGGIFVPLNRAIYRLESVQKCLITNIAHFHKYQSLDHAVINGSLVGYTPYAMGNTFEYEPPRQAFYVIDSKRGKCWSTSVWVDKS